MTYLSLLLRAAAQNEVVDELHRGVVHLDVEGFHLVGEVVVSPDGGDGHEKTEGGGNEGFGDTAGDGRETGCFLRLGALKGVQDADDRAEKANEGRGGTDGSASGCGALRRGVDDGDR